MMKAGGQFVDDTDTPDPTLDEWAETVAVGYGWHRPCLVVLYEALAQPGSPTGDEAAAIRRLLDRI